MCIIAHSTKWVHNNRERQTENNRKWRRKNKDKYRKLDREHKRTHRLRHPERQYARQQIDYVKSKGLLRDMPCIICGSIENCEFAHPSYNKPFEVVPMCRPCHKEYDNKKVEVSDTLIKNNIIDMLKLRMKIMSDVIKTVMIKLSEQEHMALKLYCLQNRISIQEFVFGLISEKINFSESEEERNDNDSKN